jgi:hypothetical protein
MPQHLKFEKQKSLVLSKCWYKVKIGETKVSTLGSSVILLNGFASSLLSTLVKWNVLHAHDIFLIFALGPFVSNIHTFQVLGTSFEASSWNKVYSIVTKMNSVTNQYKEWFFFTHENLSAMDFSWKKTDPNTPDPSKHSKSPDFYDKFQ